MLSCWHRTGQDWPQPGSACPGPLLPPGLGLPGRGLLTALAHRCPRVGLKRMAVGSQEAALCQPHALQTRPCKANKRQGWRGRAVGKGAGPGQNLGSGVGGRRGRAPLRSGSPPGSPTVLGQPGRPVPGLCLPASWAHLESQDSGCIGLQICTPWWKWAGQGLGAHRQVSGRPRRPGPRRLRPDSPHSPVVLRQSCRRPGAAELCVGLPGSGRALQAVARPAAVTDTVR